MSTYKVIQDVEAEDKILGPLTLRQFIYAGAAAILFYLSYFVATHGAAFMAGVFVPIALILTFFAIPWGRDQPTEVWALARIRFMLKPRRRIWDQSGVKELVTVTAPKKQQTVYTDGLTQTEVKSRLHALADTLDSRGWAVKNSAVNLYSQPALIMSEPDDQERLIAMTDMPQQAEPLDIHDADDMLDEQNNPTAQNMDTMIAASAKAHRQKIIDSLNEPAPKPEAKPPASQGKQNNYWFLNQPTQASRVSDDMVTFNTQVVTPGMGEEAAPGELAGQAAPNEEELVEQLEARKRELPMAAYYGHLHTIQPLSSQRRPATAPATATATVDNGRRKQSQRGDNALSAAPRPDNDYQTPAVGGPATNFTPADDGALPAFIPTPPPGYALPNDTAQSAQSGQQGKAYDSTAAPVTRVQQAAILQLANNDDLNVATLAREAQRSEESDGEVVIKLH